MVLFGRVMIRKNNVFLLFIIFLMYKDPVCNMMVDERETQHISQAGGRNVYLCSAACKREFEKNSAKYGY
jgi:YHS domain-containing protein